MELKSMVNFILALVCSFFMDTKTTVVKTVSEAKKASLKDIVTSIVSSFVAVCSNVAFLAIFVFVVAFALTSKLVTKVKALSNKVKGFKRKVVISTKKLAAEAKLQFTAIAKKAKAYSISLFEKSKETARVIYNASISKTRASSYKAQLRFIMLVNKSKETYRFICKTVKSTAGVLYNKTQLRFIALVNKSKEIQLCIISYAIKGKSRLVSFCTATKQITDCYAKRILLTPCKVTRLILEQVILVKKSLIETCNSIKSLDPFLVNCTFIENTRINELNYMRFAYPIRVVPERPIGLLHGPMTPVQVYKREPDG